MKAVVCRRPEGLQGLRVEEIDPPARCGPDQVRIRVVAAGLNFADTLMMRGAYQVKPEPPFVAGKELSGTVIEVGDTVRHVAVGERVMAMVEHGAFAEEAVVDADAVFPVGVLGDIDAAGFPIVYGTAHFGLVDRARTCAGETVVVFGAAGGVGLTSVEVAKCLGARVIAVAGGADKVATAHGHGADEVIDYRETDVRARIKELTGGKGANVYVDPVGGDMFDAALRAITPGGRVLVIGFASGKVPQIPANHLLVKNVSVIGFTLSAGLAGAPARIRSAMTELVGWAEAGKIHPHVSKTVPMAEFADAYEALLRREVTGKIVLTMDRVMS